jgi:hypothetical protein
MLHRAVCQILVSNVQGRGVLFIIYFSNLGINAAEALPAT